MENAVLKLLQCLSDINGNNCLVSVYAGGQQQIHQIPLSTGTGCAETFKVVFQFKTLTLIF